MKDWRILSIFLTILILAGFGAVWFIRLNTSGSTVPTIKAPATADSDQVSRAPTTSHTYVAGTIPTVRGPNMIFYTDRGFEPAEVTLPRGVIVSFINANKTFPLVLVGPQIKGGQKELAYGENVGVMLSQSGTYTYSDSHTNKAVVMIR